MPSGTNAGIIAKSPWRPAAVWGPPLALALVLLATELLGEAGRAALRYDRALIAAGEAWRLVTGSFVHLGWYHFALNVLGLGVLVLLCPERLAPAVWARRVLLLAAFMSAGLYLFVPALPSYVGMSGVIHGLFVLGLVPQLLRRDLIAAGCLAYLLGKLAFELVAGAPVSDEQAIGGRVVVESHLFGAIGAVLYGLVFRSFGRTETFSRRGEDPR